jgi:hypothetical protein
MVLMHNWYAGTKLVRWYTLARWYAGTATDHAAANLEIKIKMASDTPVPDAPELQSESSPTSLEGCKGIYQRKLTYRGKARKINYSRNFESGPAANGSAPTN